MKSICVFTLAAMVAAFCPEANAQSWSTVQSGEYFVDTDPGEGLATPLAASDGSYDEWIESAVQSISSSGLSPGSHTVYVRFRHRDGGWSAPFGLGIAIGAPPGTATHLTVLSAEYYVDTDPGEGNATMILALDGNFDEVMEDVMANLNSAALAPGIHTVFVRFRHRDGTWSSSVGMSLTVGAQPAATTHLTVQAGEYFVDTDPGQGQGTAWTATDGTFDEVLEDALASLNTAALAPGVHTIFVRMRNRDGTWGLPVGTTITVRGVPAVSSADRPTGAEYFIDADPGEGLGTALPAADGNFDEVMEQIAGGIPTGALSPGPHTLYVRFRSSSSLWSSPVGQIFTVRPPFQTAGGSIVSAAEYFVDVDPGGGLGVPLDPADGTFDRAIEHLTQTISTATLSPGIHTLYVRSRTSDGTWSPAIGSHLVVQPTPVAAGTVPMLSEAEYYVDADPGQGMGDPMTADDGAWNQPVESFGDSIQTDGFDASGHVVFVRVRDEAGQWSAPFGMVFGKDEIAQTIMPRNLTGVGRNGRVELSWNSPAAGLPSYYPVFRGDSLDFTPTQADSIGWISGLDSSFTDGSRANGQTYFYRILAVDSTGQRSLATPGIAATPVNSVPQIVTPYPDVTVVAGTSDSIMARVDSAFFDLDGDALVYHVQSLDTSLVSASLDQQRLRLHFNPWNHGITTVVVAASDLLETGRDSIRVQVIPFNLPPVVVSSIPDTSLGEDFPSWMYRRLSDVFSDPDQDSLTYSVSVMGGNLTASVAGDSLMLSSVPDEFGSGTIVVMVEDTYFQTSDTFVVTIHSVNDPPSLSGLPDVEFAEDTTAVLALDAYASDVDDPDASLDFSFTILGTDTGLVVSIDTVTHEAVFSAPSAINDTFGVVLVVVDTGGAMDSDTISVVVMPVNTPPHVAHALRDTFLGEDFGVSFLARLDEVFEDADSPVLTYEVGVLSAGIGVAVRGDSLFATSESDFHGTVAVRVAAGDGQYVVADTMEIEVLSINDRPGPVVLLVPADGDTIDPAQSTLAFEWQSAADVDGDGLEYTIRVFGGALDTSFSLSNDTTWLFQNPSGLAPGATYQWSVVASDGELSSSSADTFSFVVPVLVGIDGHMPLPARFALHRNFPNPFNPTTTIRYDLPEASRVVLRVYNIIGQEVRTLVCRHESAGYKSVQWDGKNQRGNSVTTGVYFIRLEAGSYLKTIKVMMIK